MKSPGFRGWKAAPSPAESTAWVRVVHGYGWVRSSQPQEDPQAAPSPAAVLSTRSLRGGGESLACTFTLPSGLGAESACTVLMKVIYKARPLCP